MFGYEVARSSAYIRGHSIRPQTGLASEAEIREAVRMIVADRGRLFAFSLFSLLWPSFFHVLVSFFANG